MADVALLLFTFVCFGVFVALAAGFEKLRKEASDD